MKTRYLLIFIIILALASYWQAFDFNFWRDDWAQLWAYRYNQDLSDYNKHLQAAYLHPIAAYEFWFLSVILPTNDPFYWQFSGFFLKILGALTTYLFVLKVTKINKAAFFASLIFAGSVGGAETFTWVSAQSSALLIPLIGLSFYFWVSSIEKNSWVHFLLSLIFLIAAFLGEMGRAVFVIFMIYLWEIMTIYEKGYFNQRLLRVLLSLGVLGLIWKFFLASSYGNPMPLDERIGMFFNNPLVPVLSYLNSIGNIVIGWLIVVPEMGGLSTLSGLSAFFGFLFLCQTLVLLMVFIKTRYNLSKLLLFFSVWVFVFFFPNWFIKEDFMFGEVYAGITHRYLALSSFGFVIWLGIAISRVKYSLVLLFLILGMNLYTSNLILSGELNYRSVKFSESLFTIINTDVPQDQENTIFMFFGNDYARQAVLEWSGGGPFAIKRGIKNPDNIPIATYDIEIIRKLVCGEKVHRPSFYKWIDDQRTIPLENIHAWSLNEGKMTNVSSEIRSNISQKIDCRI